MAERVIKIGNSLVKVKASALVPRLYRYKFGRDLIQDMNRLIKSHKKAKEDDIAFGDGEMEILEDMAFIMAQHADASIPDTTEEWLETIDGVFSVFEILPAIVDLWNINQQQTSSFAKK